MGGKPYDVRGGLVERRQLLRMGATGGAWWATLATAGGCSSQRDAERNATRGSTSTRQPVPEPTAMVRTNWSKDPWARGSYSYLPVGATPELRRALGTPIGDRLFFAGEATDLGDPGTVHGARASGMRVATQVAAATGTDETLLIIGAGMAGLTAAFELSAGRFADRRYRVRLVEARDRLGGRLDSVRPAGLDTYAERGASWVHGIETNELDTLVHEARIDTVPFDYHQATLGLEGRRLPTDYLDEPADAVEQAAAWARRQGADQALADAVEASGFAEKVDQEALEHYLTTEVTDEYGASAARLSARWALEEGSEGTDLLVVGGYSNLARHLANQIPKVDVRLSTPVAEVAYDPDGVTVITQTDETLSADRVIVTVPLGVLQAGDISFSPALSEDHQTAIDDLGMGQLDKVILYFDTPFWQEAAPMWTRVAPGHPFREWFNTSPGLADTQLTALTGGDVALAWAEKTDHQVQAAALAALATFVAAGW